MLRRCFDHRILPAVALALWAGACTPGPDLPTAEEYSAMHRQMMRAIEQDVRETVAYIGKDRLDPRVMEAVARVPRHEFVPLSERTYAYENRPLPIGEGQTISQPYIVALMTDMLALEPDAVVLEVGTGSGYQAAVLAELAARVYSIEIVEALGLAARERLARLGYDNVEVRIGDGYAGWPEQAPFDAVIVTAAAPHIPDPLVEQLKKGGRMAIPVGDAWFTQQLMLVTKDENGQVSSRSVLPVAFVPLTGGH
jgi:protein-L-isoaspartate(D-aspartate) O-methyltransferase